MSSAAVVETRNFEAPQPEQSPEPFALEEAKDNGVPSVWRSLLQLRLLIPYIGKLLPVLDGGLASALAPAKPAPGQDMAELSRSVSIEVSRSLTEVNKGFLDLQAGQREIRSQVVEQHSQLKRIDDQLLRLRESTERNTMEHQELVEDLRSASRLIRNLSTAMIVLMVAVAAMVTFMLAHWRH